MLLITMNQWLGPGRKMSESESSRCPVTEKQVAFATRYKIGEALARIRLYQNAYNDHYLLAVNFRLISVSTVDDLSDEELAYFDTALVERLERNASEFDDD